MPRVPLWHKGVRQIIKKINAEDGVEPPTTASSGRVGGFLLFDCLFMVTMNTVYNQQHARNSIEIRTEACGSCLVWFVGKSCKILQN
jgi:hypothetical protein